MFYFTHKNFPMKNNGIVTKKAEVILSTEELSGLNDYVSRNPVKYHYDSNSAVLSITGTQEAVDALIEVLSGQRAYS